MSRAAWLVVVGAALAAGGPSRAAEDKGPAGTWKVMLQAGQGRSAAVWLLKLESKDNKWTGTVLDTAPGTFGEGTAPESKIVGLRLSGGILRFAIKLDNGDEFSFEGKAPEGKTDTVLGSLSTGQGLAPAELQRSQLKDLSQYGLAREAMARASGAEILGLATALLQQAGVHKAKPEEVRSWAARAMKVAEAHGPRMERGFALQIAQLLSRQDAYKPIAVEYAHRVERLLEPQERPQVRQRTLDTLAGVLKRAGKADEARALEERAEKVQFVKLARPPGRKQAGTRAALVELFTGAECPPCVAADVAFDGLAQTYKPTDVVTLEYHLHIPGPDPLTDPASLARQKYYGSAVKGTPTVFLNGQVGPAGGGPMEAAQAKYNEYVSAVNRLLDRPVQARLDVHAVRKGDTIDIQAEASDVEKPGEKIRLRVALVERVVHYEGGNGIRFFRHVVRDLPGGAKGLALTGKTGKQSVKVDLKQLRRDLNKYLSDATEELAKKQQRFPTGERPLDLEGLVVVAFIQDDQTKEVLQAVQVPVTAAR